jgi:hypothetical protein
MFELGSPLLQYAFWAIYPTFGRSAANQELKIELYSRSATLINNLKSFAICGSKRQLTKAPMIAKHIQLVLG